MVRRDSFVDFVTWCAVGGIVLLLAYAYTTPPKSHRGAAEPVGSNASHPAVDEHLFKGYRVIRVIDGDSLQIAKGDHRVEVRVFGIDCPEQGQPFADDARAATEALAFGKTVVAKRVDVDRFGRMVAIVQVGTVDLAAYLVEQGLAWHFKKFDNSQKLASMEIAARRARRGLWSEDLPIPPWEYRESSRELLLPQ